MVFDDFQVHSALTADRCRGSRDVWGTREAAGGLQDDPRMPGNPHGTHLKILKKIKIFHIFDNFRLWGLPARPSDHSAGQAGAAPPVDAPPRPGPFGGRTTGSTRFQPHMPNIFCKHVVPT